MSGATEADRRQVGRAGRVMGMTGGLDAVVGQRCAANTLARAQDDRVDDQAVLVDQAGIHERAGEPCAALGEQVSAGGRSCLSRVTASARSPAAICVSPQSADVSESENTTLGISFIASANGPETPGQ